MTKFSKTKRRVGKIKGDNAMAEIVIEYTDGRSGERRSKEFTNTLAAKKFYAAKLRASLTPKVKAGTLDQPKKKKAGPRDYLIPYPEFPLYPHALGYWSKKIKGKTHHFGRWGRMVDGEVKHTEPDGWKDALEKFNKQVHDLQAGREPDESNDDNDDLTIRQLVNYHLNTQKTFVDEGEKAESTYEGWVLVAKLTIELFGRETLVSSITPNDFRRVRAELAKRNYAPTTLKKYMERILAFFVCCNRNKLISKEVSWGDQFRLPSSKKIEESLGKKKKLFSRQQVLALLEASQYSARTGEAKDILQLKAMILLGINCGFGNTDCAKLKWSNLNLKDGWVNDVRSKTKQARNAPLWPETVEALKQVKAAGLHDDLVFFSSRGNPWTHRTIGQEFRPFLKDLGFYEKGIGFYTFRHTFGTVAEELGDAAAVERIMGHKPTTMAGKYYVHRFPEERLLKVSNTVREWLFDRSKEKA